MAKSKEIHGPLLGSPVPGPMHRLSLALTHEDAKGYSEAVVRKKKYKKDKQWLTKYY